MNARYARALEFARQKHAGQYRIGGEEYITHPIAVAECAREWGYGGDYLVTALFHDLLEDTSATESEILALGGDKVLEAVKRLTKRKDLDMAEYVAGIRENEIARVVKAADRLHNLKSALVADTDFKRRYILESIDWYLDFSPEIPRAVKALAQSLDEPLANLPFLYEPIDTWKIDKTPIRAVLFDLDDTLLKRTATFRLYCERLANELGIADARRREAIEYLIDNDKNGYAERAEYFRGFINAFGLEISPDALTVKWQNEFGSEALPNEGLIETLKYLREKYQLAIVTNGARDMQYRKIDALGIREYFRAIVISEEIGFGKPDKRVYLRACELLGADVSEAIFIGDNRENDVEAPRRAGLRALWFNPEGVKSLAELRTIL